MKEHRSVRGGEQKGEQWGGNRMVERVGKRAGEGALSAGGAGDAAAPLFLLPLSSRLPTCVHHPRRPVCAFSA